MNAKAIAKTLIGRKRLLFTTTYAGEITHQAAEVAWGGWMTPAELTDRLADPGWPFVPDGRQLVEALLADGDRARFDLPDDDPLEALHAPPLPNARMVKRGP